MRYSKPEIVMLGEAARLIGLINPKRGPLAEPPIPNGEPAYDLDE
jgi:hypothetical protein